MTPEKDKQLCEKYPELFSYRNNKEAREPIAWGIECGDGWYDILDVLCGCIQNEVKSLSCGESHEEIEEIQPKITQVKEKFGGLRLYTSGGSDGIYGMIKMAESLSYRICEDCGVPAQKRSDRWIRVTCDSCEEKRRSRQFP